MQWILELKKAARPCGCSSSLPSVQQMRRGPKRESTQGNTSHINEKEVHTNEKEVSTNGKKAHKSGKRWVPWLRTMDSQMRTAATYQYCHSHAIARLAAQY